MPKRDQVAEHAKRTNLEKYKTPNQLPGLGLSQESRLAERYGRATTPVRTKWDDPNYTGE